MKGNEKGMRGKMKNGNSRMVTGPLCEERWEEEKIWEISGIKKVVGDGVMG